MKQRNSFSAIAALALALLVPSAPVQASEVVKLARLVITGKRLSSVDVARGGNLAGPQIPQGVNEARPGSDEVLGAVDGPRQFRPI